MREKGSGAYRRETIRERGGDRDKRSRQEWKKKREVVKTRARRKDKSEKERQQREGKRM